jgi:cytoskeleton protein RodZ
MSDVSDLNETSALASMDAVPLEVGRALRDARERQGISVSEVAASLKLHPRQIQALEAGQFDSLPGMAFVRGFLRNYARYLKLDPAPLLATLDVAVDESSVRLAPPSNASGDMPRRGKGRVRRSLLPGVAAASLLFAVVLAGWYYDSQRVRPVDELLASLPAKSEPAPAPAAENPPVTPPATEVQSATKEPVAEAKPETRPADAAAEARPAEAKQSDAKAAEPKPVDAKQADAKSAEAPKSPAASDAARPAGGVDKLGFHFEQESWVEVKDAQGRILLSQLVPAGSSKEVEGPAPLTLVVGNAQSVKLTRNGKPVDLQVAAKSSVARLTLE